MLLVFVGASFVCWDGFLEVFDIGVRWSVGCWGGGLSSMVFGIVV